MRNFIPTLTIAMIVLKLAGAIHWPWIAVLAPLWIPFAIGAALCAIWVTMALMVRFWNFVNRGGW